MRYFLAGAWQPPAAATLTLPVDASTPSPRCRWLRQHHYSLRPSSPAGAGATTTMSGALRLSYSTLLQTSQAAPVPAAPAAASGRRRHRRVVASSSNSSKSPTAPGGRLGASSAAAGEHKHEEAQTNTVDDLAALLDILALTEKDILPEMSKRNRARLGVGQDRGGSVGLGDEAAHDR